MVLTKNATASKKFVFYPNLVTYIEHILRH